MYASEKLDRLEGTSGQEKGGLVIMKKGPATDSEKHEFKKPEMPAPRSLLGLDRLALAKRLEKEEVESVESGEKGFKKHRDDANFSAPKDRRYRERNDETPSYTGGVNSEFLKKTKDRKDKDRGGFYASSKNQRQDSEGDRSRSERAKYREDPEGSRSKRSERSDQSSRRDWDETPARRRYDDTPRLTPKDTPSRSSWDDEDSAPSRRSSWDFPTPSPSRDSRDREIGHRSSHTGSKDRNRSSRSTPAPTPSYKYNEWMKDRKKIKYTPKVHSESKKKKVPTATLR